MTVQCVIERLSLLCYLNGTTNDYPLSMSLLLTLLLCICVTPIIRVRKDSLQTPLIYVCLSYARCVRTSSVSVCMIFMITTRLSIQSYLVVLISLNSLVFGGI